MNRVYWGYKDMTKTQKELRKCRAELVLFHGINNPSHMQVVAHWAYTTYGITDVAHWGAWL